MRLELDRYDLLEDCKNIPASEIEAYHFTEKAQELTRQVGRATFVGFRSEDPVTVLPHHQELLRDSKEGRCTD